PLRAGGEGRGAGGPRLHPRQHRPGRRHAGGDSGVPGRQGQDGGFVPLRPGGGGGRRLPLREGGVPLLHLRRRTVPPHGALPPPPAGQDLAEPDRGPGGERLLGPRRRLPDADHPGGDAGHRPVRRGPHHPGSGEGGGPSGPGEAGRRAPGQVKPLYWTDDGTGGAALLGEPPCPFLCPSRGFYTAAVDRRRGPWYNGSNLERRRWLWRWGRRSFSCWIWTAPSTWMTTSFRGQSPSWRRSGPGAGGTSSSPTTP